MEGKALGIWTLHWDGSLTGCLFGRKLGPCRLWILQNFLTPLRGWRIFWITDWSNTIYHLGTECLFIFMSVAKPCRLSSRGDFHLQFSSTCWVCLQVMHFSLVITHVRIFLIMLFEAEKLCGKLVQFFMNFV